MKILITGATGFIGGELLSNLQSQYSIYALTRETSDSSQLSDLNCTILTYKEYSELLGIFQEHSFDGVIHLASTIIVEHNNNQINSLLESNLLFGTHLLEACKCTNVKWFINTGTFWQNYQEQDYNPVNLYAATKEAFEKIATYYTETSNLIFTTIKLNDTFGPNDTRPKIFNLWNQIAVSKETLKMSPGKQIINISYIEDIISGYKLLIDHLNSKAKENFNHKVYGINATETMTLKQLAHTFEQTTGKKLNIIWGAREYRKREVMVPPTNIENIPGWEQKFSLKEAIKKTMEVLDE